jgi:hypothetical protein
MAPKSPYKLRNMHILPATFAGEVMYSNVPLAGPSELRWSNFPLVGAPKDLQVAKNAQESIQTGLPTAYVADTTDDGATLPGYAQVSRPQTFACYCVINTVISAVTTVMFSPCSPAKRIGTRRCCLQGTEDRGQGNSFAKI